MHEYELRDVSLYENRTTFILDEYETIICPYPLPPKGGKASFSRSSAQNIFYVSVVV